MRKLWILTVSVAIICLHNTFLSNVYANSAKGAILLEQDCGRILYEKNAHTKIRLPA